MTTESLPRLKLKLAPKAEAKVRGGHPWVFADSVRETNRDGEAGELGIVYDRKKQFLAVGLYDPESPIRLRVLHSGKPATLDEAWWETRFHEAVKRRDGVVKLEETNGLRLINGENDGWPGFVLDRYAETAVIKIYTPAWQPWLDTVLPHITALPGIERVVLRRSRNAGGVDGEPGEMLYGDTPEGPVIFKENGLLFEADVLRGQKTGFFLDQRDNRQRVRDFARGKHVLNLFSFSGAFSVAAVAGGANSVTDVDISAHALASGARNFQLNRTPGSGFPRKYRRDEIKADVFKWIKNPPKDTTWGTVIVDPPSLARRAAEREGALLAYARLNRSAMNLVGIGGTLISCSCTAHVSADDFFSTIAREIVANKNSWREVQRTEHARDHRVTVDEMRYLKAVYWRRTS